MLKDMPPPETSFNTSRWMRMQDIKKGEPVEKINEAIDAKSAPF